MDSGAVLSWCKYITCFTLSVPLVTEVTLLPQVPVVTGRFGLPFPLLPHATKITAIVGKPFSVGNDANPSSLQLEAAFRKYESELKRMFDLYKGNSPSEVAANGFKVTWRSTQE